MVNAPPPAPTWPHPQQLAAGAIGPPAGFWIRFVAYLIDSFIISLGAGVVAAVIVVVEILLGVTIDKDDNSAAILTGVAVGILAILVGGWLYEALLTSSPRGATVGKMAIGARIVRADGTQLSFGRATGRYFLKVLITPMVPLFFGYLMAGFTSGKRALHDVMADTLVIKSP